ncbi:hypothetical protein [Corynebacterium sp. p3-SID1194]|uniref:hypothetical protein n=1 Tax=Corynebacterium sp. p3-SID1194 TaxID=2916105 RepID=UPI0021A2B455|nr:hypothetical protein [Corynebacterium sp. p3-SID1194]MCT1449947.1 hypothetical protein [Corynebacterium sp. p3-SID1194]
MRSRRASVLAAVAAIAALTAGCSSENLAEPESQPAPLSTVSAPSADEAAEEEIVTETVTKEAPAEKETKSDKPKKDKKCASLPKDPRDQYPDGEAPGRMPQAGENPYDTHYWIEDIDNFYDPCAPVSWIIFYGGRGGMDGPANTGASVSQGIAFYINGEPDGEMRTFRQINNVSLDGDTISFDWHERQQDLMGSVKLENSVTLAYDNGHIEAVDGDVDAFNQYWHGQDQYMLGHYD